MRPKHLKLFLNARRREHSTQVYTCDALWIISGALGNKIARYSELIQEKKPQKNHTAEEVVNNLIGVLEKDMERRLKNGDSSV